MQSELKTRIRVATESDIDALCQVEIQCFARPWSRESLQKDITQNDLACYIVCEVCEKEEPDEEACGKAQTEEEVSDKMQTDEEACGKSTSEGRAAGREISGYVGVWFISGEGHINNIAVKPEYRRKHIGTALVENMIEIAEGQGVSRLTLEVRKSNEAAIELYKKMGFKEFGVRPKYYEDDGEDALIMWRGR